MHTLFLSRVPRPNAKQFVACFLFLCIAVTAAERPNIVLLIADDQGWGDMGYYEHPFVKTPNFDKLSKVSLRFDRFYPAAPVCSPTLTI